MAFSTLPSAARLRVEEDLRADLVDALAELLGDRVHALENVDIVALSADQVIDAEDAAFQPVVAVEAFHQVVAFAALHHVVAGAAGHDVVAEPTVDLVVAIGRR